MESIGQSLRRARLLKGLSQAEVAKQAGVTQAHVSMIERGLNAHLSVAAQVASVVGLRLALEPCAGAPFVAEPYGEDVIANRIYLLARLAAGRVTPSTVAAFEARLLHARDVHGDYHYYRTWLEATQAGPDAVIALLTDPTEHGRYMRSVAPLRAFVSKKERDEYFRPAIESAAAQ